MIPIKYANSLGKFGSRKIICIKKLKEPSLTVEQCKEVSKLLDRIYLCLKEILTIQRREEDVLMEYEEVLKIRLMTLIAEIYVDICKLICEDVFAGICQSHLLQRFMMFYKRSNKLFSVPIRQT